MVPGLMGVADPSIPARFSSNSSNVTLDTHLPNVCQILPTQVKVIVDSGVIIDDASRLGYAMRSLGLDPDTRILLYNAGRLAGYGGNGGDGYREAAGDGYSGGGGGGAGAAIGIGGEVSSHPSVPASGDGADGTATVGGAGGIGGNASIGTSRPSTAGADGGDAFVYSTEYLTIVNANGEMWAGAGGGGAGAIFDVVGNRVGVDGGTGGDVAEDGDDGSSTPPPLSFLLHNATVGGTAGNYLNGTRAATFVSGGSFPNVRGNVTP